MPGSGFRLSTEWQEQGSPNEIIPTAIALAIAWTID
jgi:hypothetical protein